MKVNLAKSEIALVGYFLNVGSSVPTLGCKVSQLPKKYLGLLLEATYKLQAIWDDVLKKMS